MHHLPSLLTDEALTLRGIRDADLPDLARQLNAPDVARWLAAVSVPFDAAELQAHDRHPGESVRVIALDGQAIGGLCLGSSLWYWLSPDHWGQGHMGRALRLALRSWFQKPVPPLTATCHVDNAASRALLTQLGFALSPEGRRMFFHHTRRSEPCRDYLMAPEQWHLLHPLELQTATARLRPARQRDLPALVQLLPCAGDDIWPTADTLSDFVETHRFRGAQAGLFVIVDHNRRTVGMALHRPGSPAVRFSTEGDAERHLAGVTQCLTGLANLAL
ncbi:GNAT family protein [Marinovum sp.]|uniref:GNAT family N-acetyltransferase n=1 Tax=Marinovum sp. TaxID=2024839 RepID=UPI002B264E27|nr:GNAT family protein [Marinovum sp.]